MTPADFCTRNEKLTRQCCDDLLDSIDENVPMDFENGKDEHEEIMMRRRRRISLRHLELYKHREVCLRMKGKFGEQHRLDKLKLIMTGPPTHTLIHAYGVLITIERAKAAHNLAGVPTRVCTIGYGAVEEECAWKLRIGSDPSYVHEVFVGITEATPTSVVGRTFGVNLFAHAVHGDDALLLAGQRQLADTHAIPITASAYMSIKVSSAPRMATFTALDKNDVALWSHSEDISEFKSVRLWVSLKHACDVVYVL